MHRILKLYLQRADGNAGESDQRTGEIFREPNGMRYVEVHRPLSAEEQRTFRQCRTRCQQALRNLKTIGCRSEVSR